MDKDEILERFKKENLFKDERDRDLDRDFTSRGVLGLSLAFCILLAFNLYQDLKVNDIMFLYFSYISFREYGQYRSEKTRLNLLSTIGTAMVALGNLVIYIMDNL